MSQPVNFKPIIVTSTALAGFVVAGPVGAVAPLAVFGLYEVIKQCNKPQEEPEGSAPFLAARVSPAAAPIADFSDAGLASSSSLKVFEKDKQEIKKNIGKFNSVQVLVSADGSIFVRSRLGPLPRGEGDLFIDGNNIKVQVATLDRSITKDDIDFSNFILYTEGRTRIVKKIESRAGRPAASPLKARKISTALGTEIILLRDNIAWLRNYKRLVADKNFSQAKLELKNIGLQTLRTIEEKKYIGAKELDEMKKKTNIYAINGSEKEEKRYFQQVLGANKLPDRSIQMVEIIEGDSFDVALTLKHERGYQNVSVLNMANATTPGGGFLNGSSAQEEALCRRSTLFDSINIIPRHQNYNPHLQRKMRNTYQVPEFGTLFSPNVKVFRGNLDQGFAFYKELKQVNIISSAAYNLAHEIPSNYREKTKIKLQMILNTALANDQELLVLGAYGCGAFRNNPTEVASIVKEILQERPEYQKRMKIVFAIIKDQNDRNGNLKNFYNSFMV